MARVVLLLAVLGIVYAAWIGWKRGVITFAEPSPRVLCAHVCAEGVSSVSVQIDTQGALKGYACECSP